MDDLDPVAVRVVAVGDVARLVEQIEQGDQRLAEAVVPEGQPVAVGRVEPCPGLEAAIVVAVIGVAGVDRIEAGALGTRRVESL
jgi:hypothetical protein